MPIVSALGAMSSRGFGEFAQPAAAGKYIEDYFSTWLYTGNGSTQVISNSIGLSDTASWKQFKIQTPIDAAARDITVDSSGNIYAVGSGYDTNEYGLIVKYNSFGVVQWQRKFAQNATRGQGIAVDSGGNVYATGYAYDGAAYYLFLVKYNNSGVLQWQRKILQGESVGFAVTVDSSDNIYVTGYSVNGTGNYLILVKYNTSGTLQWQRSLQQNNSYGYGVKTDSSGNIYVVGTAGDGTNLYILIAQYNSSGTVQWQRNLKQGNSAGRGIAIDSSNNVYVTGSCKDGSTDYCILAKYNSSGAIQWQRKLIQGNSLGDGVSVDTSGNIYVSGYATNGVGSYMLVAKYNSSGTIQWQRLLQSSNPERAASSFACTTNGTTKLYTAGYSIASSNYWYWLITELNTDGTTTSGNAFISMLAGTATESAGGATDSLSGASSTTSSATESAGTATDSADAGIASSATQPAVTSQGGLVWIKNRSQATWHQLIDTARGATKYLSSNAINAEATKTGGLTAFTASGFTIGDDGDYNDATATYTSWTFRKQPKFFDVVTWTGDGSASKLISHNLQSIPGFIVVKATSATGDWVVCCRYSDTNYIGGYGSTYNFSLNSTVGAGAGASPTIRGITSTQFDAGKIVGFDGAWEPSKTNSNGVTYVAYVFAHNAGGFGADGLQNVISCGSFATNASGNGSVTLGYEPQWLLIKQTDTSGQPWLLFDNMRGFSLTNSVYLAPNSSSAEGSVTTNNIYPTSTGFVGGSNILNPSATYIYMAIRRGPMRTPTSGTSVFSPVTYNGDGSAKTITTGFTVDTELSMARATPGTWQPAWMSRLIGNGFYLQSSSNAAEVDWSGFFSEQFQLNTGVKLSSAYTNNNGTSVMHCFQRAPGFFDVTCYTGTGSARTVSHNLGVAPELIIFKARNLVRKWGVAVPNYQAGDFSAGILNQTDAFSGAYYGISYLDAAPTSTTMTLTSNLDVNNAGSTYVAYLFSSCPGVSKVGSYTGTGATQTISCGFTGGARYVLIKRTDTTGSWWVWDTARGMVAGTDPRLAYNSTAAETNANWVYTTTGGFQIVTSDATVNANGGTYLFLAIS